MKNIFLILSLLTFSLCGQCHKENKEIELRDMQKTKKISPWTPIFNALDQQNDFNTVLQFLQNEITKTPAGYIDIHATIKRKASKHYRTPSLGKKAYTRMIPLINLACINDKLTKIQLEEKSLKDQQQKIMTLITGPDSPYVSRNK